MTSQIPRRIIQIWGGTTEMPLLTKCSAANVRLLNQEFEYVLFDDSSMEDFVKEQCPQYQAAFHSFRLPIQRYDFFRYLAIYQSGGFYFDLDVFLASNLSDLLEFGCVFPFEALTFNRFLWETYGMDWEIGNYAFGATAGHPFIRAIIDNCLRAQENQEWVQPMLMSVPKLFCSKFYVLSTTGPLLVSRTLAEYNHHTAKPVKVLFPDNVCDATCWSLFGKHGVHLMHGGWRTRDGFLKRRLYSIWKSWKQKETLRNGLRLGPSRSLEFKKPT